MSCMPRVQAWCWCYCPQTAFVESSLVYVSDELKPAEESWREEAMMSHSPSDSHWLRGSTQTKPSLLHTTNSPNTTQPFFVLFSFLWKAVTPCSCLFFPTASRKQKECNWFATAYTWKRLLARMRTVNHLSDHISDNYLRRHLCRVLHFVSDRWPGSKNKTSAWSGHNANPHIVSASHRGRILCQGGRFFQPAAVALRCSDPLFWIAVVFACPERCVAMVTKACRRHTLVKFIDSDSSCKLFPSPFLTLYYIFSLLS